MFSGSERALFVNLKKKDQTLNGIKYGNHICKQHLGVICSTCDSEWIWIYLLVKGRNAFLMKIWHVLLFIKFGVKCKLVYSRTSGFSFFLYFVLGKSFGFWLIRA